MTTTPAETPAPTTAPTTAPATPAAAPATPETSRRTPKPHATPRRVLESTVTCNDQRIAEMTVKALQDALRACNATVSGRKAELQERLLDALEAGAVPGPSASSVPQSPRSVSSKASASSRTSRASRASASKASADIKYPTTKTAAARVATPRRVRPAKTPKASTSKKKQANLADQGGEVAAPISADDQVFREADGAVTWRGQDVQKLKVSELKEAARSAGIFHSGLRLKADLQEALLKHAKPRDAPAQAAPSSSPPRAEPSAAESSATHRDEPTKAPTPFKAPLESRRTGPRSSLEKSEEDDNAAGIEEPTPVRQFKSPAVRRTGPRRSLGAKPSTSPEQADAEPAEKSPERSSQSSPQQDPAPEQESREDTGPEDSAAVSRKGPRRTGPRSAKKIRPPVESSDSEDSSAEDTAPGGRDSRQSTNEQITAAQYEAEADADEVVDASANEDGIISGAEDDAAGLEDNADADTGDSEGGNDAEDRVQVPKILSEALDHSHVTDLQDALRELEVPFLVHEKKDELIETLGAHLVTKMKDFTVADLKRYLHLIGGKVSGRKAELQERLARFLDGDVRGTILEEEEEEDESASHGAASESDGPKKKPRSPSKRSPSRRSPARRSPSRRSPAKARKASPATMPESGRVSDSRTSDEGPVPPSPMQRESEARDSDDASARGGTSAERATSSSAQWTQAGRADAVEEAVKTPLRSTGPALQGAENEAETFFTPVESEDRPLGGARGGDADGGQGGGDDEEEEELIVAQSATRRVVSKTGGDEVIPPTPAPADQVPSGNWSDAAVPGSPVAALKERVQGLMNGTDKDLHHFESKQSQDANGAGANSGGDTVVPETPAKMGTSNPGDMIARLLSELQQDGLSQEDLEQLSSAVGGRLSAKKRKSKSAHKGRSEKKAKLSSAKKAKKSTEKKAKKKRATQSPGLLGEDYNDANNVKGARSEDEGEVLANGSTGKRKKKDKSATKKSSKKKKRRKMEAFGWDDEDGVIQIGSQSATARKLGRSQVHDGRFAAQSQHQPVRLVDDSLDSIATPGVGATPYSAARRGEGERTERGDALFPGKPKWRESLLSNQSFEQHSMHETSGHLAAPSPFANGTPQRAGHYGGPRGLVSHGGYSAPRSRATPIFPRFGSAVQMPSPATTARGLAGVGTYRRDDGAAGLRHDPSVVAKRVLQSIDRESRELSRDGLSRPQPSANSRFTTSTTMPSSSSQFERPPPAREGFSVPETPPVKQLHVKRQLGSAVQPKFEFSPARMEGAEASANGDLDKEAMLPDEALEESFRFPNLDA